MTDTTQSTQQISRRLLSKSLQKLHIKNGDVVAIKVGTILANDENMTAIARSLDHLGYTDVLLVVVQEFDDLSVLNEQEMNRQGWFRAPALKKLIHLPKDGEGKEDNEKDLA